MKIAIGNDHAAVTAKLALVHCLEKLGHEVRDLGAQDSQSVDYPDEAAKVATAVGRREVDLGVLLCGTGIGVSIAANKVPGVRAALCHDAFTTRMARRHNDANVLCMGARILGPDLMEDCLRIFLETPFEGGRHARRVDKLSALDAGEKSGSM